mgnify:CR=1 FL=1
MASHNLLTVQGIETLSTMESERPLIDALGGGGYAIAFINNTSGISYLVVETLADNGHITSSEGFGFFTKEQNLLDLTALPSGGYATVVAGYPSNNLPNGTQQLGTEPFLFVDQWSSSSVHQGLQAQLTLPTHPFFTQPSFSTERAVLAAGPGNTVQAFAVVKFATPTGGETSLIYKWSISSSGTVSTPVLVPTPAGMTLNDAVLLNDGSVALLGYHYAQGVGYVSIIQGSGSSLTATNQTIQASPTLAELFGANTGSIAKLANGDIAAAIVDATNPDNPKIAISLIDPGTLSRINLSIQGSELHGVPATINISETRTGGFLVTWGAFDNAQQTSSLYGAAFDGNYQQIGPSFAIQATNPGEEGSPVVTSLNSGNLAIAWTEVNDIANGVTNDIRVGLLENKFYETTFSKTGGFSGGYQQVVLPTNGGGLIDFTFYPNIGPDRVVMVYDGKIVLDTGNRAGGWNFKLDLPKGQSNTIQIYTYAAKTSESSSSSWNYTGSFTPGVSTKGTTLAPNLETGGYIVTVKSGHFTYDPILKSYAGSGEIELRLKSQSLQAFSISGSNITWDKTDVEASNATYYVGVGAQRTPLFRGDMTFNFQLSKATYLYDYGATSQPLTVNWSLPSDPIVLGPNSGALALINSGIALAQPQINSVFQVVKNVALTFFSSVLPPQLGLLNLNQLNFIGGNLLQIDTNNLANTKFNATFSLGDQQATFFNLITLRVTNITFTIENVASSAIIQGNFVISAPIASPFVNNISASLQGSDYIRLYADGNWDLVGSIRVNSSINFLGFQFSGISLNVDTIAQTLVGQGTLTVPSLFSWVGSNPFQIRTTINFITPNGPTNPIPTSATFDVDRDLNAAVNWLPFLWLHNIDGTVTGLQPGSGGPIMGGNAGFAVGPAIGGKRILDMDLTFQTYKDGLKGSGALLLGQDLGFTALSGQVSLDLNSKKKTAQLDLDVGALNGFITASLTAKVSKNFDFAAMGILSANIPSSIANVPVPLIGGKSLSLNGLISFKANYSLADDYVAVWLQYNVSGPFGTSKHVVGVKATFELQFSLINAIPAGAPRSALTLDGDPAISAIPQPLEMSPTSGFIVAANQETLVLSARWTNPVQGVTAYLVGPNGAAIMPSQFAAFGIDVIEELSSDTQIAVAIVNPLAGEWRLVLDTPQPLTDVLYEGFLSEAVADLIIDSVSQSTGIVSINYHLSKPLTDYQVQLFYDDDLSGDDGVLIDPADLTVANGSLQWNSRGVAPGTYYLYTVLSTDEGYATQTRSDVPITISAEAGLKASVSGSDVVQSDMGRVLTITVENSGPSLAQAVTLRGALPDGVTFISSSHGFAPANDGSGDLVANIGDLASGGSIVVTVVVDVPAAFNVAFGAFVAQSATFDSDDVDNVATFSIANSLNTADIELVVEPVAPAPSVTMGAITNYKFKVTNTGTIDAIDTVLDFDPLNVSLAAVSIVGGAELVAGIDGRFILPLVAAGDSLEVMVSLLPTQEGDAALQVTLGGVGLDDPSNNILTVPFAVSQASAPLAGDLELGVTTAPSTTDAFGSLLVVEVTNAAALPNGDVVVRIDIPAGLTILSPDGGAPDANFNPQTGLWTVGSVAPNGRAELQLFLRSLAPGSFPVVAEIMSATDTDVDSTPGNGNNGEDDIASVSVVITGNLAPTNIAGQLASILETAAPGTVLGQLTAVDPDPNQTFAYAIVGGSGIGDFVIDSGGQVTLAPGAVLDFETTPEETVVVRATDAGGLSVERVFNIAVLDGLDIISGTTGPNDLLGTAGPDSISALAGDDTIRPGGGDDFIDGGPGIDQVIYSGVRAGHTLELVGANMRVASGSETDTLANIERIRFDDGSFVLDMPSIMIPLASTLKNASYLPMDSATLVYRLYAAAYARTPDEGGFVYWATQTALYGFTAEVLAREFRVAPEFIQKYGASIDDRTYTDKLYSNVLLRPSDIGGLNFWTEHLNSNYYTRDQLMAAFAVSPENIINTADDVSPAYWVI